MAIHLDQNAYGKNAIRLSKIIRHPDRHEIRQISVDVSLQGDFDAAHLEGDNSKILPTDTMKNTVYVLARDRFTTSIEAFALVLADHFLSNNPQVTLVTIGISEDCWARMTIDGAAHPHAFINGGGEKHIARVEQDRRRAGLSAGISDLLILKTTDSGFEGYIKDAFTTLKETPDRILSTSCEVSWVYEEFPLDMQETYEAIRELLLETFADHKSLSVQHTLYAMGEAVLQHFAAVREITLKMPNKHHIPFSLQAFGLENANEIFVATDEPYGYITGTVVRKG